jgi:hypothetical protein
LKYPSALAELSTIGAGLTQTNSIQGSFRVYIFTAGTGTVTV